jgi:hypothetical protein
MGDHRSISDLVKIPIDHHITDIYPGWRGELKVCALEDGNYFIVYPDWRSKISISLSSDDGKMISKSRLSDPFNNVKIASYKNKALLTSIDSTNCDYKLLIRILDDKCEIVGTKEITQLEGFKVQCLTPTEDLLYIVSNSQVPILILNWNLEIIDSIGNRSMDVKAPPFRLLSKDVYQLIATSDYFCFLDDTNKFTKMKRKTGEFDSIIGIGGISEQILPFYKKSDDSHLEFEEVLAIFYTKINDNNQIRKVKSTFAPSIFKVLNLRNKYMIREIRKIHLDDFSSDLTFWIYNSKRDAVTFVNSKEKCFYELKISN